MKLGSKATGKSPAKRIVEGLAICLTLTLATFVVIKVHVGSDHEVPSDALTIIFVFAFAVTQLFAQLSYFLHLDSEEEPKIKRKTLTYAFMVVLILVLGSLWIMQNLNRNMGLKDKYTDEYIIKDEIPEK